MSEGKRTKHGRESEGSQTERKQEFGPQVPLRITQARRKWEVGHGCLALAKLCDVELYMMGSETTAQVSYIDGEQEWRKMKKLR